MKLRHDLLVRPGLHLVPLVLDLQLAMHLHRRGHQVVQGYWEVGVGELLLVLHRVRRAVLFATFRPRAEVGATAVAHEPDHRHEARPSKRVRFEPVLERVAHSVHSDCAAHLSNAGPPFRQSGRIVLENTRLQRALHGEEVRHLRIKPGYLDIVKRLQFLALQIGVLKSHHRRVRLVELLLANR